MMGVNDRYSGSSSNVPCYTLPNPSLEGLGLPEPESCYWPSTTEVSSPHPSFSITTSLPTSVPVPSFDVGSRTAQSTGHSQGSITGPHNQTTSAHNPSVTHAASSLLPSRLQSSTFQTAHGSLASTSASAIPSNKHSTSPKHPTPPVIAGVAVGVGCFFIFLLAFFLFHRLPRGAKRRRSAPPAENVAERDTPAHYGAAVTSSCTNCNKWPPAAEAPLPSRQGLGSEEPPTSRIVAAMDNSFEADLSTVTPEAVSHRHHSDNLLDANDTHTTYAQAGGALRDDVEPGEDSSLGADGNTVAPQALMGVAIGRQIEALQMEMARLTSTVQEAMLEVEMSGPRGPPPAYA